MMPEGMKLGPREAQVVELLLKGCDNAEIARELNMSKRSMKAHFNRLYLRYGITSGIKRVKLAITIHRERSCQGTLTENSGNQQLERSKSSLSSLTA